MKISENFTAEEFLSPPLLAKIKLRQQDPRRYINPNLIKAAEFVREFFNDYYKQNPNVDYVAMIGNKPGVTTRGFRSWLDSTQGAELSDHKFGFAFDSDLIIVYKNGTREEVNYKDVVNIILEYQQNFLNAGITMVEDASIAKTWLHFSIAWTGLSHIKLVK